MSATTIPSRYEAVVRKELSHGNIRAPVWEQAMADSCGDPRAAEERYVQNRVAQMVADEGRWQSFDTERQMRVCLEEAARPGVIKKTRWLFLGIVLSLLVFVVFFAFRR